jgi:hypothetical protein
MVLQNNPPEYEYAGWVVEDDCIKQQGGAVACYTQHLFSSLSNKSGASEIQRCPAGIPWKWNAILSWWMAEEAPIKHQQCL